MSGGFFISRRKGLKRGMSSQEILDYLRRHKERKDITIQELVQEFKLTQSTVNKAIKKMRKYDEIGVYEELDNRKQYIYVKGGNEND